MVTTVVRKSPTSHGNAAIEATLLDAVGAVDNGSWTDVENYGPFSIHVKGITTASVEIRISNDPTLPLDTAHEILEGAAISADGVVEVTKRVKWIKTRIATWTSGTISTFLIGHGMN